MISDVQSWLEVYLAAHAGVAGTVHLHTEAGLELAAAVNIPETVIPAIERIPAGKGMAGLALARGEPVQTCNLDTDESGDVRPGARAVEAKAAVALPVQGSNGGVRAVVGIAFDWSGEIPATILQTLASEADAVPSS